LNSRIAKSQATTMKIKNRNGLTHTAFNAFDKRLCDWANFLSPISAFAEINLLDN
jgi:hypothetical protein